MENQNNDEEYSPITEEDLKVDNVPNEKKEENKKEDDNKKKEKTPEEIYCDFNKEFNEIIEIFKEGDKDKNLYNKCDSIKGKYKENLLKNSLPNNMENELIEILEKIYEEEKIKEKPNELYLELLFNLMEFLPYLYHPNEFLNNINLKSFEDPENENTNFLELFKSITPTGKNKMNLLIDDMIYYLFSKYNDIKALYIECNLLESYPSRSVYISFKFICLQLFMYNKMTINNININFYDESLTHVSKLLLQEASYYNQKFNNEFYNNVFAEFDFNVDDKVKRKINNDEFKFLTNNIFKFLYLIIKTYSSHLTQFDFTEKESRKIYWSYVDKQLNQEGINPKTELEINIYTFYILMCFSLDILAFIYTNFLYLNKEFTSKTEFHFDSYDPFFIFVKTNDWKNPIYHIEFINYIKNFYLKYVNDLIKFIEIFLSLCDLKVDNKDKFDNSFKNTTNNYLIISPVNSVGLGSLVWILDKENKFKKTYFIYSPFYIFDIHLPLIAAMLKSGHSLRYLAIETLINFCEFFKNKPIVPNMKSLVHYSFDDIFNDVLDFIGSQEPDEMRKYVNSKLTKIIGLLANDAKYQFFDYYCENALKISEDNNINDEKVSYFIQIIKNTINDNLKENKNLTFWKEDFIKKIIQNFAFNYEKIFIFEIIETTSQALNFIHFIILKDKHNFKGGLKVYNKEYLYYIRKNLNEIASLVEKFVKSSDEEKYNTLRLNPNDQNEDTQKTFKLKNNQCLMLLDLINTVDNLVTTSLKELDSENKK